MTFIKSAHTLFLAGLLSATVSLTAFPALGKTGDENQLKINISGTVVATGNCIFADPMPKDIRFGDIRYSSAAGVNNLTGSYVRALDSRMYCSGDTAGNMHFRFESRSGTPVSDGSHKLLPVSVGDGTNPPNKNLGIRFLVNGKIQDVDSDFSVDMKNPPTLEVELVQIHPDDNTWSNGQSITSHAILTLSFD
ncbi:hypothetical protein H8R13_04375 [Morganella morganii]|uniref:hypothetical protein n=1 Tax=Morganella morganii TaxID=582 RepID=UPI00164C6856|nr:hypothetical protein [Morganella morganii]MBC4010977.1 hypothetical protein [Morganella morganii]MCF1266854.1 hypothetical protein [Morganella morganii]